jgi:hypothetical protein
MFQRDATQVRHEQVGICALDFAMFVEFLRRA